MACMGPDDEHAKKKAAEAYRKILLLLENDYGVGRKSQPITWVHDGKMTTVELPNSCKKDRENAKKKLRKALEELFWIQACEDF